ncbi:hypothetical protein [Actinoplanes sp. NPDC049681]|uniref:hypothetical protein n=1 Tax=Actinoplanes sp. NPDC049681 TaxID=3363905 RepID=UPI00378C8E48
MFITFAAVSAALLVLAAGALLIVRTVWPAYRGAGAAPDGGPSAGRRRPGEVAAVRWRWAGIAAGLAGAALMARVGSLGLGLLLAAPVFGSGVLVGALVGELARPAPGGPVRSAGLRVRRAVDYVPRVLGAVVVLATVILVGLTCVTTAVAGPDDLGRAGRALTCVSGPVSSSYAPWPGRYYTVPGMALIALGLIAAAVAVRRVVRRPQSAADVAVDDAQRRRSAEVVVAAAGVSVLTPLTGFALTAGLALDTLGYQCGGGGWSATGRALTGLAIGAFAATAWCGACLLVPGRGRGRRLG